jgi:hypothetical protein
VRGKRSHSASSHPILRIGSLSDSMLGSVSHPSYLFISVALFCSVVVSIPFAWLTIRKIGVSSFEKISFAALDSGKADSITGNVDEKDEV